MADVPLLTAITETFGPNMWFNTIVALTHAAAAPPDGSSGPISYDTYTRTRTQLLQQNIRCNPHPSPLCPITSLRSAATPSVAVLMRSFACKLLGFCTVLSRGTRGLLFEQECVPQHCAFSDQWVTCQHCAQDWLLVQAS